MVARITSLAKREMALVCRVDNLPSGNFLFFHTSQMVDAVLKKNMAAGKGKIPGGKAFLDDPIIAGGRECLLAFKATKTLL